MSRVVAWRATERKRRSIVLRIMATKLRYESITRIRVPQNLVPISPRLVNALAVEPNGRKNIFRGLETSWRPLAWYIFSQSARKTYLFFCEH